MINRPTTRTPTTISTRARSSGTDRPLRCRPTYLQHSGRPTVSTRTRSARAAPRPACPATDCSPSAAPESPCESRWRSPRPWVRTSRAPRRRVANHSHRAGLRAGRGHATGRQVAGRSSARRGTCGPLLCLSKSDSIEKRIDRSFRPSGRCSYCGCPQPLKPARHRASPSEALAPYSCSPGGPARPPYGRVAARPRALRIHPPEPPLRKGGTIAADRPVSCPPLAKGGFGGSFGRELRVCATRP